MKGGAGIVKYASDLSAEGMALLELCAGILISYAVPSGLIPYSHIQNLLPNTHQCNALVSILLIQGTPSRFCFSNSFIFSESRYSF